MANLDKLVSVFLEKLISGSTKGQNELWQSQCNDSEKYIYIPNRLFFFFYIKLIDFLDGKISHMEMEGKIKKWKVWMNFSSFQLLFSAIFYKLNARHHFSSIYIILWLGKKKKGCFFFHFLFSPSNWLLILVCIILRMTKLIWWRNGK